uniref:SOS response-associated peptidase family protein n=1 Tax=Mesorhizobium sp. M0050 TaxID=2956861 RepID=UPI0012DDE16A|nr:SOS response-associated peptidase family protein [Mesorhizobium sp. L2C054A000]
MHRRITRDVLDGRSPWYGSARDLWLCLFFEHRAARHTGSEGDEGVLHIYQPGPARFSFAGLWAYNSNLDITNCTIITEPAADAMLQLHDRQPLKCRKRWSSV